MGQNAGLAFQVQRKRGNLRAASKALPQHAEEVSVLGPTRFTVVWTREAEQDRTDIWDHIALDDSGAAARLDMSFSDAAAMLAAYPMLGRMGTICGTRELIPHENYRLVYQTQASTVWILALVHVARQWPPAP